MKQPFTITWHTPYTPVDKPMTVTVQAECHGAWYLMQRTTFFAAVGQDDFYGQPYDNRWQVWHACGKIAGGYATKTEALARIELARRVYDDGANPFARPDCPLTLRNALSAAFRDPLPTNKEACRADT